MLDPFFMPLTEALAMGCIIAFIVTLGANVGSFLNVVVHRVPRGESLVFGGSRCPACRAAIRWRHNVPVLGWLLLRGRCHDCQSPIACRYPIVEAMCATMVGVVASVELLSGGATLPGVAFVAGRGGSDGLLFHTDWSLVAVCTVHCFLLVTLFAWALFDVEGHAVPRQWKAIACGVMIAAVAISPLVWPKVQTALLPVGLVSGIGGWPAAGVWWRGLAVSGAGAGFGWLVGSVTRSSVVRSGLILCGFALGWQAVGAIAILIPVVRTIRLIVCKAVRRKGPDHKGPDVVAAAVLHLLLWRQCDQVAVEVGRIVNWIIFSGF